MRPEKSASATSLPSWFGSVNWGLLAGFDHPRDSTVAPHGPLGAVRGRRDRAPRRARARGARRRLLALGRRPGRRRVRRRVRGAAARRGGDRAHPVLLARPRARPARARSTARGARRLLLLGHIDTVVAHDRHRPLHREEGKLVGSGAIDMKGGDVLAIGVMRALAKRPEAYGTSSRCCSSATRSGAPATSRTSSASPASTPACASRAASRPPDGEDAVIVRRKAAGTVRVTARGRAAHSGSAPDRGRNALLALAAAAQAVAACHDPAGPDRLTSVPTILQLGRGVQRRARRRRAVLRLPRRRARRHRARARRHPAGGRRRRAAPRADPPLARDALASAPSPRCSPRRRRRSAARCTPPPAAAPATRATSPPPIPVTIDGLGPRGGRAHNPEEFVHEDSLTPRAEVALAVVSAVL